MCAFILKWTETFIQSSISYCQAKELSNFNEYNVLIVYYI